MSNIQSATGAYTKALNQLNKATETTKPDSTTGGSFSDLVKESLNSAIDAQKNSEKVSAAAIVGNADMTEVLQAITKAEMSLNTVLAVRDKVVQAYQQVINMPM